MTTIRRLLHLPVRLASWVLRPPDFHACRFANDTNEDDT